MNIKKSGVPPLSMNAMGFRFSRINGGPGNIKGKYRLPDGQVVQINKAMLRTANVLNQKTNYPLNFYVWRLNPLEIFAGYINKKPVCFFVNRTYRGGAEPYVGVIRSHEHRKLGRLMLGLAIAQSFMAPDRNMISFSSAIPDYVKEVKGFSMAYGIDPTLRIPSDEEDREIALQEIARYMKDHGISRISC